ncbi:MAG: hypothetical protein MI864_24190, partial [Pseudomonadales bacterium]|nr:hypothetical protein [Pseudomonadales bacterium]
MQDATQSLPHILEAHYEDACFLYLQWWHATDGDAPNSEFANRLALRLKANLSGLMLQPDFSLDRAFRQIETADPGECFVAAYLAFRCGNIEQVKAIIAAGNSDIQNYRAVADGLSWDRTPVSETWMEKLATSQKPELCALGTYSKTSHQPYARAESAILQKLSLIQSTLPLPVTSLLLAGLLRAPSVAAVTILRQRHTTEVSFYNILLLETRITLGDTTACAAFHPFIVTANPWRERAIRFIFPHLEHATAKQWIDELRRQNQCDRVTLIAIGALREQALLPWVIRKM